MSHQLQLEQWVAFPVEHVFPFFSNPRNLPRIMPAQSDTRIVRLDRVLPPAVEGAPSELAAGVGSIIVTSFRMFPPLPVRTQWIARIVEFEWESSLRRCAGRGPLPELASSPRVHRANPARRRRHAAARHSGV